MESLAQQALLDPQAGGRIQSLSVECDLAMCSDPSRVASLVSLMDICVGAPDARELLNAARRRLLDTQFFELVTFRLRKVPGGSDVSIKMKAATVVREIEYEGHPPLLASDVERRIQLRRGSRFPDDPQELEQRKESVAVLYEQNGYYGTRVKITPVHVGKPQLERTLCDIGLTGLECRTEAKPGGLSQLVDVTISIEKGRELEVERVVLGGHRVFAYQDLRALLLEPIGLFGSFTDQALKAGIKNILDAYRQRGFYRARVVDRAVIKRVEQGTVEIRLELDEGPRWELEFLGNKAFPKEDLEEQVTFSDSGYVDKVEIRRTIEALRSFYETAGYYFAKVQGRERVIDDNNRQITFEVREGQRFEIKDLRIVGDEAIPEETLLAALRTSAYNLFATGGFLQRAEIEADLGTLVSLYRREGYLSARVPNWEIALDKATSQLSLGVFVDEGVQTVVRQVFIRQTDAGGDLLEEPPLSNERLARQLVLRSEEPFSRNKLNDDLGRIIQAYHRRGYPRVEVEAQCRQQQVPGGDKPDWGDCELPSINEACFARESRDSLDWCEPGPCGQGQEGQSEDIQVWCCQRANPQMDCSLGNGLEGSQVDIRVKIEPGPYKEVSDIFVRGNFRTRGSVILDEMPLRPGDRFDRTLLYEGQSNLRSLGLFEAVTIEPIGLKDDFISVNSASRRVALVIVVEEADSQFLEFRFGGESRNLLEDNSKFILTVEGAWVDKNPLGFGLGYQLNLRSAVDVLEVSSVADSLGDGLDPFLTQAGGLDFLVAAEAIYFDPRFSFFGLLPRIEMSITLFWTLDLLGFENNDLDKEELGARVSLRKDLKKEVLEGLSVQLSLERSLSTTRSRSQDPRSLGGDRLFGPRIAETKVIFSPVLDRRKKEKLNPTHGYLLNFSMEYAFDFLGSPTEYLKLNTSWSQYFTYFKNLTLAYGLQVGRALPLGQTELLPADERFRLGGTNSLRGFRDDGVGPLTIDFAPLGGELLLLGHTELRFPLLKEADIFGVYFVDSGVLVDCRENGQVFSESDYATLARKGCLDDITTRDLRTSAGLGIRWLVAGRIPLALDYGIILNRRIGEEFGNLNLNVGYIF